MEFLAVSILSLFYTSPGFGLISVVEDMKPTTQEEANREAQYLLGFLQREEAALGSDHPRLACDTLHVARVIRGWAGVTAVRPEDLLLRASGLTGKCASDAMDEYFSTPVS